MNDIGTTDLFAGADFFAQGSAGRDAGTFGDYGDFASFTTTTEAPGFDYSDLFGDYNLDYNTGSTGFDNYNYMALGDDDSATTTFAPTTFPIVTTPQTTSTSSTSTTTTMTTTVTTLTPIYP